MADALESDKANTAFVGAASKIEARGIIIMELENDLGLDQELISAINAHELNAFEHIYVYKNIVVTVDDDFVTDYDAFFALVDIVVKDNIE